MNSTRKKASVFLDSKGLSNTVLIVYLEKRTKTVARDMPVNLALVIKKTISLVALFFIT